MKKETFEEVAKRIYGSEPSKDVEYYAFIEGVKWQQERSYNERDLIKCYCGHTTTCDCEPEQEISYSEEDMEVAYFEGREGLYSFNDWFEQFKKKL